MDDGAGAAEVAGAAVGAGGCLGGVLVQVGDLLAASSAHCMMSSHDDDAGAAAGGGELRSMQAVSFMSSKANTL